MIGKLKLRCGSQFTGKMVRARRPFLRRRRRDASSGRLCEARCPSVEYGTARTPSTRRGRCGDGVWAAPDAIDATCQHTGQARAWRWTPHATFLLGLGRVPPLLPTIDIPMIRMERVPREGLLRLLTVRYHLSSSNFSDRLPDAVRQAHRVRARLLEGLLAHADALVVHGQQRFQRAALRREDILRFPELPGLPPQLAVGDLRRRWRLYGSHAI